MEKSQTKLPDKKCGVTTKLEGALLLAVPCIYLDINSLTFPSSISRIDDLNPLSVSSGNKY